MNDLIKNIFKNNIVLINIVEACGIIFLGLALYSNWLIEEAADEVILLGAGLCLVLASLPALTAWALLQQGQYKLQKVMRAVNWGLILFWLIEVVLVVAMHFPKSWIVYGAVFLVLPGWINIRALSLVINGREKVKQRRQRLRTSK